MFIYNHIQSKIEESWFPLNVMAWQIIRLRFTCYWSTLFELFQGCLVFFALFLARQSILSTERNAADANTLRSDIYSTNKIYYTPHNNFTDTLMDNVIRELNNDTVYGKPSKISWQLSRTYVLFEEKQPTNVVDNNIVIVNFMDPGFITNNFTYYIKMFNSIESNSESQQNFKGIFSRISPPDEVTNPFLGAVQWAIDKSYIKQLVNENVTDLELKEKVRYITRDLVKLHKFIILCTVIAPMPFYMYKSSRIIVAMRTGLRGLIRLSGVSSNVYRIAHLLDAAAMGTVYGVIIACFLKATSQPILPYSNCLIIVIAIILYFLNVFVIAMLMGTFFCNNKHASSAAFVIYVCSFMFDFTWHSLGTTTSGLRRILCCILPHAPMYMFWAEVSYMEYLGYGAQFSNIAKMHCSLSILETWLFSLIQLTVLFILDWYIDSVKPGKFGLPRKWYFIFKKDFLRRKRRKRVNFHMTAEYGTQVLRDHRYFEEGPPNAEIAVKICNVSKIFRNETGRHYALDDISLDIYRGEVTVILGQSSSGKTVLMSIIAGLYAASSGTIYVNGLDNVQRIHDVLDVVALCPQQSIIHTRLTVRENIMLFVELTKKGTGKTADELMMKLNIMDVANFYHTELSKGLLRCLQVACALASDSDVLVLDEPTSGMDYEARHRLWDLIMDLRGEKTIIMTTSYLEEAEVLGDRIAILSKGKLRCHGSPSFLREAIGSGFNLTITLKDSNFMQQLSELVSITIPNMKSKMHGKYIVSFVLPITEHDRFPELFDALEDKSRALTITAIDVGLIMEDIFLEFIDETDDDDYNFPLIRREADPNKLEGWHLILQQFKLLVKRNYRYLSLNKYEFIILQVLIPIIGLIITSLTTNRKLGYAKFFQIEESQSNRFLYNMGTCGISRRTDDMNMNELEAIFTKNVEKDLKKFTNATHRSMGISMSPNKSKLITSSDPYDVSKAVNTFSNIYLKLHMPNNSKKIITTYKAIPRMNEAINKPKSWFLSTKWCVCVIFISVLNLTPSIVLSIRELITESRDAHISAGCSPYVHWGSKLVTNFSIYMAVVPVSVAFGTLVLDFDKTFNNVFFVGSILLLLILFGLAFLAHLYFLSFISDEHMAITEVFIMSLGFGIVIPIILQVIEYLWDHYTWLIVPYRIVLVLANCSPLYPFCVGIMHLATQARLNAFCNLNKAQCPDLKVDMDIFSTEVCCESSSKAPFDYIDGITGFNLMFLILHFIVYSTLVIMMEKRIIHTILERIVQFNYKKPKVKCSPEVKQEADSIKHLIDAKQYNKEVFMAYDVHKSFRYFNCLKHKGNLSVVTGISLKAKAGECIGIVGPPGAGKSTMLKMLAGALVFTRGNSWIHGYSLKKERSKYITKAGRAGLDLFLTGLENLLLIAQLQGLSENKAMASSALALQCLGLNSYRKVKVRNYSLACRRRLELAMLYVMSPVVAFLDRPVLNVDPVSKPMIVRALETISAGPTTILMAVTSVTRSDMESLYDRLAILSGGQFAAIGPAAEVISELTSGYIARIKLNVVTSYKISAEATTPSMSDSRRSLLSQSVIAFEKGVKELKKDFKEMFASSILIDEHVCLIIFYIEDNNNKMLYSEMFSKLHKLKRKYEALIDHYTLSAATIQDMFTRIKHAKEQM